MKKALRIIIILIGAAGLVFSVAGLFMFNVSAGIFLFAAVSCAIIAYGLFFNKLTKAKWLNIAILCVVIVCFGSFSFLYIYGKTNTASYKEDAAVVLGAGLKGSRVSKILANRLDEAVSYYEKNPGAVIVVSGGQGFQEDMPEADAMEAYLAARGVPENKIYEERESSSTYENLEFSKKILDGLFAGPYKTVVITSDFHAFRAELVAKRLGYDAAHIGAKTQWYAAPMNYMREILAIAKTLIIG